MKLKFKHIFTCVALGAVLVSCEKTDNFSQTADPILAYTELQPTTTANAVVATATSAVTQYNNDDIIEAYVSSSDEGGTFYNSISFQTLPTPTTPPVGFSVSINLKSFPYGFTPGRKVYIKLKNLYYTRTNGSVVFGSLYNGSVGRLNSPDWQNFLFISAEKRSEDELARTMTLDQATANSGASYDPNINTLIDIANVRFADTSLSRTWYDVDSGGGATNHNIVDVTNPTNPKYFRVSSYALFAYKNIPSGTGVIRAVLTKYGSDYQFIPRFDTDVRLTNDRTFNYVSTLTENFESSAVGQYNFANYINIIGVGTKYWSVKSITSPSATKELEMSAYRSDGTGEYNKSYFMIPVNFDNAHSMSFQSRTQFYNNAVLRVYMTKDFVLGNKITDATLYDITSNFTISSGSSASTPWTSSGTFNFPNTPTYKGNGFIVFEYSGNSYLNGPANTTTMQLDNIVIN